MKKRMYAVLAILTVFALVLGVVSCGGGSSTTAKDITVSFDLKGGKYDGNATIPDVKIKENSPLGDKYPDSAKLTGPTATPFFKDWVDANKKVYGPTTKISKTVKLEATWSASQPGPQITISYDVNVPTGYAGAKPVKPEDVKISSGTGLSAAQLAAPSGTDADLTFLGWFKAATGGDRLTQADVFTADATIYAQWHVMAAGEITVTFKYNYSMGGAAPADIASQPPDLIVITKEGEPIADDDWPADPVRAGYIFKNWLANENGTGKVYTIADTTWPDGSSGSVKNTVWALWESVGGPVDEAPPADIDLAGVEKVTLGNQAVVIYSFTLPTGKKWTDYKEIKATVMNGPLQLAKAPNHLRLLGNYKVSDFTFDTVMTGANEGKKLAIAKYAESGNSAANKYAPYIIVNSSVANNTSTSLESALSGIGIAAEQWTWFDMTYDIVNGTPHGSFDAANKPDDSVGPFYFGMGFPGSGGTESITTYFKEVTLVGYVAADNVKATPVYFTYDDGSGDVDYPAFAGWGTFSSGDNGIQFAYRGPAKAGETFAAIKVQAAVTFNLNYTSAPAAGVLKVMKGKALGTAFPANPTRTDGLAFAGWNTAANGSGAAVTADTTFDNDTTVYAQWAAPITITLNPDGGKWGTETTKTFQIGTGGTLNATQLAAPEKAGYRFDKWVLADGTTTVVANTTTFAADTTIKVIWVETVAVSFKLGNGAADIVAHPDKGTVIADFPANPSWTGYDFDGWNLLLNGKGVQVANTTVFTRNINVYAVWKAKVVAPVDFVLLKDGAAAGNGTDPGTAVNIESKKNAAAFTGNYGNVLDLNFSFPTGFNYTSYSSLTIKYVITTADGTEITEVADGLGQFKLRASGTDVALQYNLGGTNGGAVDKVGDKIPLPLSTVGEGCPKPELYGSINNIFIQSGGQTTAKSVGFIEITEITFHTSMSGDAVVINIDEPSLTDPLFNIISNQTWKVSTGDLTISMPAGYDVYGWAINGAQQGSPTRNLTLLVSNYATKINTNVTVTAFAVIDGMPYSKTIVVKVAR